jgi:hypothetical protein
MELAVSKRRPLIPVRVEDAMPTEDMQFFLGVSHWFNAFAKPIDAYLPEIVASTQSVLAGHRRPWRNFQERLPRTRVGQVALTIGAAALVALGVAILARPRLPGPMDNPLAGRWQTRLADGRGGKTDCVIDIAKSGAASFSDDCPLPFAGASGALATAKDGTFAPQLFQSGDTGTALLQGGTANGYGLAFRRGFFGQLTTRDSRFGVLSWSHAGPAKPSSNAAADILPAGSSWPLSDTSGLAKRATAYLQSKWNADAVLMEMDLKTDPAGAPTASFTFYSPGQQQAVFFQPGLPGGALVAPSARVMDTRQALPKTFLDLPAAIDAARTRGMRGHQVSEAKLAWTGGPSCGTGNFRIDNAILPKCPPHRFIGFQWQITSAIGETVYVPAS